MFCSDRFLNYLKSFGYNAIRLPKSDIRPLQVLTQVGRDLDRLGELTTILVAGENVPVPTIEENIVAASIAGQRTGGLSLGVGLSILGSVLGAMGGSKLGLDVKYRQARTVAFEFTDVLEDQVEVAKLDQYLADADINPFSRYAAELLEMNEVFVTTATIKSNKFTVEARKQDETTVELSIPELQQIVGGNVQISGSGEIATKVTYTGGVPLVFGFQAVRIFYDRGKYTTLEPLGARAISALERAPDDGAIRFTTDSAFARLRGD